MATVPIPQAGLRRLWIWEACEQFLPLVKACAIMPVGRKAMPRSDNTTPSGEQAGNKNSRCLALLPRAPLQCLWATARPIPLSLEKGIHAGCRVKRTQPLPTARPSSCWGVTLPAYLPGRFPWLLTYFHSSDLGISWFLWLCIILFVRLKKFLTSVACLFLLLLNLSQRRCSVVTTTFWSMEETANCTIPGAWHNLSVELLFTWGLPR